MYKYFEIKRFFEKFDSNPYFQKEFNINLDKLLRNLDITISSDFINEIIEAQKYPFKKISNQYLDDKNKKDKIKNNLLNLYKTIEIKNKKFNDWRNRQTRRIKAINSPDIFYILPNVPVIYELSCGCSVQCSFCCFDPDLLNNIFRYNDENKRLWNDILIFNREQFGELSGMGACYFATEPLDNPDYEEFIKDFHSINNWWPQLTTALHTKYPDRIKKYMSIIGKQTSEYAAVRFSVNSINSLDKIHEIYSAEILEDVEMVFLNKESSSRLSPAGRGKKLMEKNGYSQDKFYLPGAVACVTGFVINMCDKSIKLISTTIPDEDNPYGYILFDKRYFNGIYDYKKTILDMIDANMKNEPDYNEVYKIIKDYKVEMNENEIIFSTDYLKRTITSDNNFMEVCKLLMKGHYSLNEIKNKINNNFLWYSYLVPKIKLLFNYGMIYENDMVDCCKQKNVS